jgi:hypothetical protein
MTTNTIRYDTIYASVLDNLAIFRESGSTRTPSNWTLLQP